MEIFRWKKISTFIHGFDMEELKWNEDEGYEEYLSLNEILEQVINANSQTSGEKIPLLRVEYESGLWGVIFEVGNDPELGKQWIVHGITKGYA